MGQKSKTTTCCRAHLCGLWSRDREGAVFATLLGQPGPVHTLEARFARFQRPKAYPTKTISEREARAELDCAGTVAGSRDPSEIGTALRSVRTAEEDPIRCEIG